MALFPTIPNRTNGQKITYGWFEALKTAVDALAAAIGGSASIGWTAFTFANNTGPSNVTGALLDSSASKTAKIEIALRRYTATNRANCLVELYCIYDSTAAAWVIVDQVDHGDVSGVTWTLSGQQLQYTSDNMSGSGYSGASHFRVTAI